uniref:Uncharacterized protein n=1 Tax=Avena sativa TaxID=4498 RepID=A0ACD5WXE2_AVESA
MEGKRNTTLMVIMCLLILSLTVKSAKAECGCCSAARAKACCFGCIAVGGTDTICKNTCCFPCFLDKSGVPNMEEVVAKMQEIGLDAKMKKMEGIAKVDARD